MLEHVGGDKRVERSVAEGLPAGRKRLLDRQAARRALGHVRGRGFDAVRVRSKVDQERKILAWAATSLEHSQAGSPRKCEERLELAPPNVSHRRRVAAGADDMLPVRHGLARRLDEPARGALPDSDRDRSVRCGLSLGKESLCTAWGGREFNQHGRRQACAAEAAGIGGAGAHSHASVRIAPSGTPRSCSCAGERREHRRRPAQVEQRVLQLRDRRPGGIHVQPAVRRLAHEVARQRRNLAGSSPSQVAVDEQVRRPGAVEQRPPAKCAPAPAIAGTP